MAVRRCGYYLLVLFLFAFMPSMASAQNLVGTLTVNDSAGINVGDTVTVTITVTNQAAAAGGGSARMDFDSAFAFVSASCTNFEFGTSPPAGFTEFLWDSIPDAGGQLAQNQSDHCDIQLRLQNLPPNPPTQATLVITPSGSVDLHNFKINYPAPSFSQNLAALVNGQSIGLNFAAVNASSCVGSSTPSVAGWDGVTLCTQASTCGNVNVNTPNLSPGGYSFTATCFNPANVSVSSNASATIASTTPMTNLTIDGSASPSALSPGQSFSMQLIAHNAGSQDAPLTQVAVTTPAQILIDSSDCGLPTGFGPVIWNIGTLTAGSTATCNVQATAQTAAASIGESLLISFAGVDTNSSDDMAVIPITIGNAVDLSVAVTTTDTFQTGAPASLLITVANAPGASAATGVSVSEYTSAALFSGNGANTCNAGTDGTFNWNVGNLAGGQSMSCTISGTVVAVSAITVTATAMSQQNDGNLANNAATLAVQAFVPPVTESKTVTGAPTTKNSTNIALSGDSNHLVAVFESQDPNLVANNTNTSGQDIYTKQRNDTPQLETVDTTNHPLGGTSSLPAISDDAAIVAFVYRPGAKNAKADITGNIWAGSSGQAKHQVDLGMSGAAPNGSANGGPAVAVVGGSGKLVFCSSASNLVAGDGNNANDIFLVDPANPAQATQLISRDASGLQLQGDSCEPKLSADGNKVVFTIAAPNLYGTPARQVVRKDLVTGALDLISQSTSGAGKGANADSSEPTISADGSTIAFTSKASDLDALGEPVGGNEAFVSLAQPGNVATPRLLKRLRSGDGVVPNGASQHPQISHDGTVVVMQTLSSNFFGVGKSLSATACGSVAITTNFFNPAVLGAALCNNGSASNQNPAISGDGSTTGFDSNAPQAGTNSSNSNAYSQGMGASGAGVPNLGADLSGQWFDTRQSGQGLVIDVLPPFSGTDRLMAVTWFVFLNGQATWVQGAAIPHAGTFDLAGKVVVQMDQVAIYTAKSFPIGETKASGTVWGSITLVFADTNTGSMTWHSSYPGFNSGTMAITHLQPVRVPANDAADAKIKACYSGNWAEPDKQGHGFEFEVTTLSGTPILAVDWFTFTPQGAPVWLYGGGVITGNTSQMQLTLVGGSGAQFPPRFDATRITQTNWGGITFTFTDATHGHASWNSTLPGYGAGQINLVPEFGLERRGCN